MKKLTLLLLLSTGPVLAQTPEERIAEMGIELPDEVRQPSANFVKWRQVGNLLFLAGEGSPEKGTLGKELTTEEGYEAARNTGIRILATKSGYGRSRQDQAVRKGARNGEFSSRLL